MIDLSILATPLALLTVGAPPPPDPAEPPPPFNTNPPSRVLLERAALRWEEWYWRQEGTIEARDFAATCGPSRPGSRQRRCFITYLATAPEEQTVQIIDWLRRCRVVRGTGHSIVEAPPASGGVPIARVAIGKGRQMECVFSGYAVNTG